MQKEIFSPMAIDALGEMMNISLGSSATAVSNMLDHRVDITTPTVSVVEVKSFSLGNLEPAIGVEIKYVEGLEGSNIMLLKRSDIKVIVDILMGMETPDEEFELMKTHSAIGADMLKSLPNFEEEPIIKISHEICRWHHERYDGKGYPDGLEGDEIPLSAQIVSIVDVYDELVSERIFKKPVDKETAFRKIMSGECGVFAPKLLQCFEASKKLLELFSDSN